MSSRKNIYDSLLNDKNWLRSCIEAIFFISENPVDAKEIADFLEVSQSQVSSIIQDLEKEYSDRNKGFMLRKVAGGYRFYSNPALNEVLKNFVRSNVKSYLSQAALETLAVMCYLQPVTRTQIAEIRGVRTDSVFQTLLDKGLIREAGKLKEPGNPKVYRTASRLLEILGIGSLEELPPLKDFNEENPDTAVEMTLGEGSFEQEETVPD